jgi:hypothetical protein
MQSRTFGPYLAAINLNIWDSRFSTALKPGRRAAEAVTLSCSFAQLLKPGGRLLISDYCRAPAEASAEFAAYIAQRGYDLHSVEDYGRMIADAGFRNVRAEDRTWQVRPFYGFWAVYV